MHTAAVQKTHGKPLKVTIGYKTEKENTTIQSIVNTNQEIEPNQLHTSFSNKIEPSKETKISIGYKSKTNNKIPLASNKSINPVQDKIIDTCQTKSITQNNLMTPINEQKTPTVKIHQSNLDKKN